MSRHVVAAVAEFPPGSRRCVTLEGRRIALFNVAGRYFGLLDRCPHQGGPLSEGVLTGLVEAEEPGAYRFSRPGEILRCPWHGWEFDLATGESRFDPRRHRTRAYRVETAAGADLKAETVPVRVEEDYVVVEI